MGETKFTPGPWSIVRYGDGSSLVIHSDADNRVCFMATASSDRPSSHPAIRANARLIAAAPALFEALHDLVHGRISDSAKATEATRQRRRDAWENAKAALLLANTGGTENG